MSRVYFHMLDGTVEVHGSERHRAAQLVEGIGASILSRYVEQLGLDRSYEQPGMLRAHFSMLDGRIKVAGREINGWQLLLNTALDTGNEAICFLTKFHAQSEIHAWVAGEHRAWLAGVIEQAIELKIVRPEVPHKPGEPFSTGWRELIAALRRTDANPVVMSYSVTAQFPNYQLWNGDEDNPIPEDASERSEAFYDHTLSKQWDLCMPAIRDLQMTPENLCTYGFGDGMSALGLAEILDNEARENRS